MKVEITSRQYNLLSVLQALCHLIPFIQCKTFSTVVACSLIVFVLCDLNRDAKCGKIQCQGGANRPVIGTNAVSIETNIPLQEGGRILCRGTHVYLGDDMPDPGLVLAGTKCANGMV